jgi:hypothetical protein
MKQELKNALERTGWDEIYEASITGLGPANPRGERRARSPFPDVTDHNPSFTVNVQNGLWRCFQSDRAGDYILFRAIMDAEEFDENGRAVPDYGATERNLLIEFGCANPVPLEWVAQCRDLLQRDLALREGIARLKPWDFGVLYSLNIGFDSQRECFTIPVHDRDGRIANCHMYRPGGEPKMHWSATGLGGNFLFPHSAWRERSLILCEGETDVLSLRSLGFPACSGTLGSGSPVPDGNWYYHKTVYVLMDEDEPGEHARIEATRLLIEHCTEVRVMRLPEWEGRPDNADVSDYIRLLYSQDLVFDQVVRAISRLVDEATVVEPRRAFVHEEASPRTFQRALSSENVNHRITFKGRVAAKSSSRYVLPVQYNITCPARGHSYCRHCPMQEVFHGNGLFVHEPRTIETLSMVQVSKEQQLVTVKENHGIPRQCPDPVITVQRAVDVETVMLTSSSYEEASEGPEDKNRREAYMLIPTGGAIEDNRDYDLEGMVYPHPKTQSAVFLLDVQDPLVAAHEHFEMTSEKFQDLRQFTPYSGQPVIDKLLNVAQDIASSHTLIYGRDDLHLAYRSVFHSIVKFNFRNTTIDRGWIECMVIGDTRCGKSAAFKRMATMYGSGTLVDCKVQTLAGILGSVVQSPTGEYYVVAGLLPQHDNGIVCFDEFHVPRYAGSSGLIESLSSTRSEGTVRITKAAQAEFKARVRSIWLANPGAGKLMSELSHNGVELISRLITQPEDIARFDIALALSQADVSSDVINEGHQPTRPQYLSSSHRDLLAWTWSRRPEHVHFLDNAERRVLDTAKSMCERYDPSIPLVEIADQRTRIAKLAVSIAAQCFSTDPEGKFILVLPSHVEAAEQLFTLWYDNPIMGYNIYSQTSGSMRVIINERAVMDLLQSLEPHATRFAEELLRLEEFSRQAITTLVPVEGMFPDFIISTLSANRAIQLVERGRRDNYEKTTAMTAVLKNFLCSRDKLP